MVLFVSVPQKVGASDVASMVNYARSLWPSLKKNNSSFKPSLEKFDLKDVAHTSPIHENSTVPSLSHEVKEEVKAIAFPDQHAPVVREVFSEPLKNTQSVYSMFFSKAESVKNSVMSFVKNNVQNIQENPFNAGLGALAGVSVVDSVLSCADLNGYDKNGQSFRQRHSWFAGTMYGCSALAGTVGGALVENSWVAGGMALATGAVAVLTRKSAGKIDKVQREKAKIEVENQRLKGELTTLEEENKRVELQQQRIRDNFRKQAQETFERLRVTQGQLETLKKENDQLLLLEQTLRDQHAISKEELHQRIDAQSMRQRELRDLCEQAQEDLAIITEQCDTFLQEWQNSAFENEDLKEKITTMKESIASYQDEIENYKKQIEASGQITEMLKTLLSRPLKNSNEKDNGSLEQELSFAEEIAQDEYPVDSSSLNSSFEQDSLDLEQIKDLLEQSIRQDSAREIEAQEHEYRQKIETLKKQYKEELELLNKKVIYYEQELLKQQETLQEQQEKPLVTTIYRDNFSEENAKLAAEVEKQQQRISLLQGQLDQNKKAKEDLEELLQQRQDALRTLSEKIEQVKRGNAQFQAQLKTKAADSEELVKAFDEERQWLQEQLSEINITKIEYERQVIDLEKENEQLKSDIEKYEEERVAIILQQTQRLAFDVAQSKEEER
jgi:chromosome segregation ATPase